MRTRTMFFRWMLCALLVATLSGVASGTDDDRSWDVLRKLSHRSSIIFWLRSTNRCIEGQLRKVTDTSVQIEISAGKMMTIERKDVLKVGDYLLPDFNFLYVARNSWQDVMALHAVSGTSERVRVATRNGKKHEGEVATVDDKAITLNIWNKQVSIARAEVAAVDYVRYKTVSDQADYLLHESVLVTPETWVYAMGLQPRVSVRVFDGTQPENNIEIKCDQQARYWSR